MSVTTSSEALQGIFYISNPAQFEGSQAGEIRALIDLDSKVNAITPIFVAMLCLSI